MNGDFEEIVNKENYTIDDLVQIVRILRSENGCPWDKVQTHESIKKDFVEEVYEVLDAIDCDSEEMMKEELGDVLLQVIFHTVLEEEKEHFVLQDVMNDICKKLIVRHPHVFGEVKADTVDKVLTNWDSIKKETKGQQTFTDTLKSVPKTFPSLMKAQKLGKRADRAGIDYENSGDYAEKIKAQLEKAENSSGEEAEREVGKLLFLVANYGRSKSVDSEQVLSDCCKDFVNRFEELEKGNDDLSEVSADELYSY